MADEDTEYLEARKRVEARMGFYWHLAVYVVINVIFLIVVGWDFLWATVFWGLGVASHAYAVFLRDRGPLHAWKEQAIARELGRKRGPSPAAPTQPMPPSEEPTKPIEG